MNDIVVTGLHIASDNSINDYRLALSRVTTALVNGERLRDVEVSRQTMHVSVDLPP